MIEVLGGSDIIQRIIAADTLGQIGDSRAIDPLINAINTEEKARDDCHYFTDFTGYETYLEALRNFNLQQIQLKPLLEHADKFYWNSLEYGENSFNHLIGILERTGDAAIEEILKLIEGNDRNLIMGCINILYKIGNHRALETLRKLGTKRYKDLNIDFEEIFDTILVIKRRMKAEAKKGFKPKVNLEGKEELFVSERDYYEVDLIRIDNKGKVKDLTIELDLLVEKIDLSLLKEFNKLEKLTIQVLENRDYRCNPILLWPELFNHDFRFYDAWEEVDNYLWSCTGGAEINLDPIRYCRELKEISLGGERMRIINFEPIAKCKNLKELKMNNLHLDEVKETNFERIKDSSSLGKIILSGHNMRYDKEWIEKLTDIEVEFV